MSNEWMRMVVCLIMPINYLFRNYFSSKQMKHVLNKLFLDGTCQYDAQEPNQTHSTVSPAVSKFHAWMESSGFLHVESKLTVEHITISSIDSSSLRFPFCTLYGFAIWPPPSTFLSSPSSTAISALVFPKFMTRTVDK